MNSSITIFGCGWLGKDLGIFLKNKGYTVTGSTTKQENLKELIEAGIDAFIYHSEIKNIPEKYISDNIVIAFPPGKNGDYSNYENQLVGLLNLIGNEPKRIILISSTSAYPKSSGNWSEKSEYQPDTEQAKYILNGEDAMLKSSIAFKIVLRFAGLIDKNRNPANWIKDGKSTLPGDEPVNLIHKTDCIQIIEKLLTTNFQKEIFNACADEHPTRGDFYKAITLNSNIEFGQDSGIKRIINNTKLKEAINYEYTFKNPISFFAS
jgi:nucleoside-diphosphate-sugar epimerase